MIKVLCGFCLFISFFSFSQKKTKSGKILKLEIDSLNKLNTSLNDSLSRVNSKNVILSQQNDKLSSLNNILNVKLTCQKIGDQYWMKQNLNVIRLNDGSDLFFAETNEQWDECFRNKIPAYCYHQNDTLKQNGVLYNLPALTSGLLAPKGYKIPHKNDIEELINSFHSNKDSASYFLKSNMDKTWKKRGLDLFNMNIYPNGFRLSDGKNWYSDDKIYFFCNSNDDGLINLFVFSDFSTKIYFLNRKKDIDNVNYGLYVRCILENNN